MLRLYAFLVFQHISTQKEKIICHFLLLFVFLYVKLLKDFFNGGK